MSRRRSSFVPGAARNTGPTLAAKQASIQPEASSTGRSGTITPETPASTASRRNVSSPCAWIGFRYVITRTGTSIAASAIVSRTFPGVAPASSASREAVWITPPSITGSENGIPTSIASAPAFATPRRSSASTEGRPPVTYGAKMRPPPPRRALSATRRSSSLTGRSIRQRAPHRLQVLVAAAGEAHEHRGSLGEGLAEQPADHVRGLQRGEDALRAGELREARERVRVGRGDVLREPG